MKTFIEDTLNISPSSYAFFEHIPLMGLFSSVLFFIGKDYTAAAEQGGDV